MKNSWGENWGDNGYFKMLRGKNHCEIEENVIVGNPDFFFPLDYDKPSLSVKRSGRPTLYIKGETDKSVEDSVKLHSSINQPGGGINLETGYSRRIEAVMPWVDFSRPVQLEDLPDFDKFVAGVDSNIKNIQKKEKKNYEILYIIIFSILNIILIFILILYRKKKIS